MARLHPQRAPRLRRAGGTIASLAALILALGLASCEPSPPPAPSAASAAPQPVADPALPDSTNEAKPPPLLPPAEETPTLDEILRKARAPKSKAPPPSEPPPSERPEKKKPKKRASTFHSQSPEPEFDAVLKRKFKTETSAPEERNDASTPGPSTAAKEMRAHYLSLQQQRANAKAGETMANRKRLEICPAAHLPQMGEGYDPECERRYQEEAATYQAEGRRIEGEMETLREEARHADIPLRYLESGEWVED